MSACRSCPAVIRWVINTNGKRVPLDPEPVEAGNIVFTGQAIAGVDEVRSVTKDEPAPEGAPRYVSHFATCPGRDRHRKAPR